MFRLLIVTLLLASLATPMTALSNTPLKVSFVGGAPLQTFQPRVIIPLLTEAFKRNGIAFEARHVASARALLLSNSGEADGELHRVKDFHAITNNNYPNLVRIDSELLTVHLTIYALGSKQKVSGWSDLSGKRVAYQRGRKNVERFLELDAPPSVISTTLTDYNAFTMLTKGYVDFVVSESPEGLMMIETVPEFGVIREVARLEATPIYAYMHSRHAKLAERIAKTLEEMKRDGSFQRIFRDAASYVP